MDSLVRAPVAHPYRPREIEVEPLRRRLEESVDGEVRFDTGSRAAYARDASNYRQVPIGVVVPYTLDAGVARAGGGAGAQLGAGRQARHLAELLAAALHDACK